jgi:REP element-mobilizing transposase RayT
VTTNRRKSVLDKADTVDTVLRAWHEADAWLIGRYVFMPDHVHLFCAPRDLSVSLPRWVKFWKAAASRRWPRRDEQPVWQLDFWDTQLRHGESYAAKWDYVWRNPVRKGLAVDPKDWPYAGELNVLAWHEE